MESSRGAFPGSLVTTHAAIAASVAMVLGLLAANGAKAQDADMDFTQDSGSTDMDFTQGDSSQGDVVGELAAGSGTSVQPGAEGPSRTAEAREEIYAVQQIYALRLNRVELAGSAAFTLNDPFVSHAAAAIGLNYWWTNVLAIGANFLWYEGLETESDLNFFIRRSTRLAVPISSYQLGAHLDFTYVPLYGKFAMFNEFIFQWDAYIVGGVGLMRTRPIPVVDAEVRRFDYDVRVAFNLGLGLRVFVSRWLAVFGEIRNYMYLEQLEALDVALGQARLDPTTWTQDSPAFTSNVTVHLGLTFFLPFDFEYRLPR
jgi:outer membrane beta-barrel protein